MYVAILKKTIRREKELIDSVIERIENSRMNYIFRTSDPFNRLIKSVEDEEKYKNAILKHRFYVEYKINEVRKS